MAERLPPEECANCGAAIPRQAKACPECGADERTGWRDADVYDGLELPEQAWRDEPSSNSRQTANTRNVNGIAWYWWCVAAALLLALVLWAFGLSSTL